MKKLLLELLQAAVIAAFMFGPLFYWIATMKK
jgi:hypothetical protein